MSHSRTSPAWSAARRNGFSYTWVALHGRHQRRNGSPTRFVRRVDTSPFTSGFVTIERCSSAIVRRASMTSIPAPTNGFDASKIRFAASELS